MEKQRCCCMITSTSLNQLQECNKATHWGPLYFCCGLMPLVNDITALSPVYNKWYMDDGGIIGDVELQKVWDLLLTRGPALGLHLNPAKCEWSWLDPACKDPCPSD